MNNLQRLQLEQVTEQEKLCVKCMKKDTMLCHGMKLVVDDRFDTQNTVKLNRIPCHKLLARMEKSSEALKYKNSLVPQSYIDSFLVGSDNKYSVELVDGDIVVDGDKLSVFSCTASTVDTTQDLWDLILSCVYGGLTAKYIYPLVWYKNYTKSLDDLFNELVENLDLLVVERIDLQLGHDFKREIFFSALDYRIKANKHTLVTIGDTPVGKTKLEENVYKEILTWKKF